MKRFAIVDDDIPSKWSPKRSGQAEEDVQSVIDVYGLIRQERYQPDLMNQKVIK
jgi:hypothetical protein